MTSESMVQKLQNMINDREDLRWVNKARRGDRRAFDKLVLKHQKRIYFTVRKLVKDYDVAHDMVQDVFVKCFQKLHQFDGSHAFYPWLHRIAVNTSLNYLKKEQRRGEVLYTDSEALPDSGGETPEEAMVYGELAHAVEAAIGQLSEPQRQVFILRTSEGLQYEEIARELSISTGTVMSRLSRARERLKNILEPHLTNKSIKV
ncbi:sigma-70 family RNA polymerase sigma factor [bacterium]|nr:sigma-70 family RNA polymerase sigma factor [bacterium]